LTARDPQTPIPGVVYYAASQADAYLAAGDWLDLTIGDALRAAGARDARRAAVIDERSSMTFSQLDARTESVAASLLALGLHPGDRALFQIGTSSDFFLAFFGCLKAGIVPVCTLPQHREYELEHFAALSGARAVFVQYESEEHDGRLDVARRVAGKHADLQWIVATRAAVDDVPSLSQMAAAFDPTAARRCTRSADPSSGDVAVFQLSGGSTGLPKIVPRMHGEYLGATFRLGERFGLTVNDRTFWALPLVHNAGMLYAVLPVALERRTLILRPRADATAMVAAVAENDVTFAGSIGPVTTRLLQLPDNELAGLRTLKQMFFLSRAADVESRTGVTCSNQFGMTEGLVLAAARTDSARIRHETVGYPVSKTDQVVLRSPSDGTPTPRGAVGELCYRGPHQVTGYYRDLDATTASLTPDGFFRTGDLMKEHHIDNATCYSFEGRIKDNINRGGEKIGAEEVEAVVLQHPAIADVGVVAMPDPEYGEKVCAFILVHAEVAPPDVAALGEFLLSRGLAKYKLPERVEVVSAFPLTRVGKIDKQALRTLIRDQLTDER
jgi:non-ribosomal peptide synthetase component E (peptide arylation enzyme)